MVETPEGTKPVTTPNKQPIKPYVFPPLETKTSDKKGIPGMQYPRIPTAKDIAVEGKYRSERKWQEAEPSEKQRRNEEAIAANNRSLEATREEERKRTSDYFEKKRKMEEAERRKKGEEFIKKWGSDKPTDESVRTLADDIKRANQARAAAEGLASKERAHAKLIKK